MVKLQYDRGPAIDSSQFIKALSIASISCLFFFATWTYAFGFGRWFYASSISAMLVFASFALTLIAAPKRAKFKLLPQDIAFLGFLSLAVISGLLHPNSKTINYILAYIFSFIGLAIILRLMIEGYREKLPVFLLANVAGIGFISAFVIFEFFCSFALGINVQALIPRNTIAVSDFLIFRRVYGFAEEPTYVAWHLNTLGVLAVWTVWTRWPSNPWRNSAYTAATLISLSVTFSLAGFICLISGLIVGGISFWRDRNRDALTKAPIVNAARVIAIVSLFILCGFLVPSGSLLGSDLAHTINGKGNYAAADTTNIDASVRQGLIEMSEKFNSEASDSRHHIWISHIPYIRSAPLTGQGPGYLSSIGLQSSVNLFLFMAVENGILSALVLGIAFFLILIAMLRSKLPNRHIFVVAFTAGIIHLLTMTQHFHPAIWLLVATFFAEKTLHDEKIQSRYATQ